MADIRFILYNLPDNSGTVQAYVEQETLWLTQKTMAHPVPQGESSCGASADSQPAIA